MKSPFRTTRTLVAAGWLLVGVAGCKTTVAVEPIEVKPIHLTLDINLKVDRELDQFFDFQDPASTQPATQPATAPETPPATAPATTGGQS